MNTCNQTIQNTNLAKSLAAEDIRCGDFVAILDKIYEFPSFLWHTTDPQLLPPDQPIRIRLQDDSTGEPLKVKEICLPFVRIKNPNGKHSTLDIRQCRLVRLSDDYAKAAWKQSGKSRKKKKKSG